MIPDGEARQGQIGRNRVSAGCVCQAPMPDEALGVPPKGPSPRDVGGESRGTHQVAGGFTRSQGL